jgi:hypothetical protein
LGSADTISQSGADPTPVGTSCHTKQYTTLTIAGTYVKMKLKAAEEVGSINERLY